MSLAYVKVSGSPVSASSCEITCEGDPGPNVLAFLTDRLKMDFRGPMNGFKVPAHPLLVINLLEKSGYKVIASSANKNNFIWTLEQDTMSMLHKPVVPGSSSWVSTALKHTVARSAVPLGDLPVLSPWSLRDNDVTTPESSLTSPSSRKSSLTSPSSRISSVASPSSRKSSVTSPSSRKSSVTSPSSRKSSLTSPRKSSLTTPRKSSLTSPSRKSSLTSPSRKSSLTSPSRKSSLTSPSRKSSLTSPEARGLLGASARSPPGISPRSPPGTSPRALNYATLDFPDEDDYVFMPLNDTTQALPDEDEYVFMG